MASTRVIFMVVARLNIRVVSRIVYLYEAGGQQPAGTLKQRRQIMRVLLLCGVALLLAGAPLGAKEKLPADVTGVLDKAEAIELLSLDPKPLEKKTKDDFHGYKVLGKTVLKTKADREKIVKALKKGIDDSKGLVAGCFNPRHGIRATVGGTTVELV